MKVQTIRRMIAYYLRQIPAKNEVFKRPIILFGTGQVGTEALHILAKRYKVSFFVDNDTKKWGKQIEGTPIKQPTIDNLKGSLILIASSFVKEISIQLNENGLERYVDYFPLYGDINHAYSPLFVKAMNRLSRWFPRSKRQVIIGGWHGLRFADNSRYLFIMINQYKHEFGIKKITWITQSNEVYAFLKSNKFNVRLKDSWGTVWASLRAKYHIIDQQRHDINPLYSAGAVRLQLWHGIPIKKLNGKSYLGSADPDIGLWNDFSLLASSAKVADILSQEMEVPKSLITISEVPRNQVLTLKSLLDVSLPDETRCIELINDYKAKGKKIIGYFPTFREKSRVKMDILDSPTFHAFLRSRNLIMVVKEHFNSKISHTNSKTDDVVRLPKQVDLYPFLSLFDLVVTDYSSIAFDFLIYQKPLLFYPYDYEEYRDHERGFAMDYDQYTPGIKVFNEEQLMNAIHEVLINGVDEYKDWRLRLREELFESNSEKLVPLRSLFQTRKKRL
ncbi:CDP-glycerol glycerophosphotransferase family protein [Cohnella fermenti]|uniref:CDP-glycerol glycerophosphotransferase family protein n=1 Tax=Cohnella fermenti TaxID=2565925 RepID=A0A4S4C015_9BACL|nr:CDP-glycerol glycerophosphotransferase family protein [Cohnella fermenti]THF80793.1 hypothetical protein E6C55_09930 [Cohnella fermenti]